MTKRPKVSRRVRETNLDRADVELLSSHDIEHYLILNGCSGEAKSCTKWSRTVGPSQDTNISHVSLARRNRKGLMSQTHGGRK